MRCLAGLLLLAAALPARADDLASLREAAAREASETLPQLRLAKALHDRGDRLVAFSILEHARRQQPESFRLAFHHVFRDGPASTSADEERARLGSVSKEPANVEALKALADLYLWRSDFQRAADTLSRAASLAPDDFAVHANLADSLRALGQGERGGQVLSDWEEAHPDSEQTSLTRVQSLVGRDDAAARKLLRRALEKHPESGDLMSLQAVLHQRAGRFDEAVAAMRVAAALSPDNPSYQLTLGAMDAEGDPAQALDHYLSAYFLDPYAGLDAPASTRIKELTYALGAERGEALAGACKDADCSAQLLADANPVVVKIALRAADLTWRPWHREQLVRLLFHDDPDMRMTAVAVLGRHVDAEFAPRLRELLSSEDLNVRSACAFLAEAVLGEDALPLLASALESPVEGIRRDAILALARSERPEAVDLLQAREKLETKPMFKTGIRAALASIRSRGGPVR